MSLKKKLFSALGPLLIAAVIVAGLLLIPTKKAKLSPKTEADAANSMAINVLKGNIIKNSAMHDQKYVAFFGSSELSRFDPFHPSVLAEKYHRSYRPFLFGAAGTQSLEQFSMIQSMHHELKGKKAVFIISPQWFVPKGVTPQSFEMFYSPLQTYQWLYQLRNVDEYDIYYAKRLIHFKSVRSDTSLKAMLKDVSKGEELTDEQRAACKFKLQILSREDEMYGKIGMISKNGKIKKEMKKLPHTYSAEELDQLAYNEGKKHTGNNKFQIDSGFYTQRIQPVKASLKNSQADFDYRQSPEFADFQLVLSEMAKLKMDVLFIIPPINERWSEYTGLSQSMIQEFSKKITYQLESQGFTNIADLTKENGEDYFMQDTIHLGWRGWLAVDDRVAPFLENRAKYTAPDYRLDSFYYTKEWQKQMPNDIP